MSTKRFLSGTAICLAVVVGLAGALWAAPSLTPPVTLGPKTLVGDGSPPTAYEFFLQPGSTWKGDIIIGSGISYSLIVEGIDVTGVTGPADRQVYFNLQDAESGSSFKNLGISARLQDAGAGGRALLQCYQNFTSDGLSSHGFNAGDLTESDFDLRFDFTKISSGDVWHITPYYRLSGGSWTIFYDGAFSGSVAFDFLGAKLAAAFDGGADGTLTFDNYYVFGPAPGSTYVDDDWAGYETGVAVQFPGETAYHTMGIDAFASIQAGISYAMSLGNVFVAAGYYAQRITVSKTLFLGGAQTGVNPTLPGARTNPAEESVIDITGLAVANPNVAVEVPPGVSMVSMVGFTIIGSPTYHYPDESAIRFWGAAINISDCIIDGYYGILDKGNSGGTFQQNRITANKVGITVQPNPASNMYIHSNVIMPGGSPASDAAAMYLTGVSWGTVSLNIASGFSGGNGLGGSNLANVTLSSNSFTGCKKAINIWGNTTFVTINNNNLTGSVLSGVNIKGQDITISNNTITGNGDVGIDIDRHVIDTQRVTVYGNDLSGNTNYGLRVNTALVTETVNASGNWWGASDAPGVAAEVTAGADYTPWLHFGTDLQPSTQGFQPDLSWLHVDDNGPQSGSAGRIQEAIDMVTGSTVTVHDGSYGADPATGKCAYITKNGLNLVGESQAGTVIDGTVGGVGSSGSYWPAGIHVQANNVTVRNFTIEGFMGDQINTGGYGIVHRDWSHDTPAEGYIFYDGCTVDSLTVKDSYSAIYALCFTHLTVSNCTATDNEADGMFIARGCDYATITDNVVTNSGDHGIWVGICWSGLEPSDHVVIRNNTVDGAEEGGISFVKSVDALIEGNTITNVAGAGWSKGALSLKDGCSEVVARYNVIHDNDGAWNGYSGTGHGIGVDGTPSYILLQHNTIYGNTGYGCYNYSAVDVDATYNWWGDATGPGGVGPGTGDEVSAHVLYDPWVGKVGAENIVCDPDPEHLTNTAPSKTIAVKYLGGGGGLMYGYSLKFTWDSAVVTTAAAKVTEGDLLSGHGTTQFFKMKTGASEMRVDCVLLGGQPGVTGPGTLFTVEFTGAGCGTSPVDITLFYVRDNLNNDLLGFYEDDGSIVVDLTKPVFTVNGPWPDGACYNVAPVLDLGASDTCGNLDDGYYRVDSGVWQTDAGLFIDYGGPSWTNAAWTLPGFDDLTEGSHTVEFYCTDELGNSSIIPGSIPSWSFVKDTVNPGPVTGFAASPGHRKVHLSWANPGTDFDHVVVVRKAWAAASPFGYPEYIQPADGYPTGPGDGVAVYSGIGTTYDDPFTLDDRSVYFYRAFAYDCAGNFNGGTAPGGSIPVAFAQGDRATNYWLGDVSKAGGGGCDGYVDYFDIVALSAGYWLCSPASPPGAPYNECDVGPTDDRSRLGLPLPDDYLDFEDLMIFALNYSVVDPLGNPSLPDAAVGLLALRLEADGAAGVGDQLLVRLMLDGNRGEVKGVSVVLTFEPGSLHLAGITAASGLTEAGERVFFTSKETEPGTLWIDLAVLGTGRVISGSGELADLVFTVKRENPSPIRFADSRLRGTDNQPISAQSNDLTPEVTASMPQVTCLVGAQPNPLTPGTAIRYDLSNTSRVELLVYDARGRLVRTLVDAEQPAGRYSRTWDATDTQGREMPCGVYFVKMQAGTYRSTVKLVKVN